MPLYKPIRSVFRHQQDTDTNCGRACVQSVISSLTQSPAAPAPQPPPTDPVPISQAELQRREKDPIDPPGTAVWYTHPDELLALLKKAKELAKLPHHSRTAWRIGSHDSLDLLMADVVTSLAKGVPALVNTREIDHWVVVAGASVSTSGALEYVQLIDPLDVPPSPTPHTYRDACNSLSNGHVYVPWQVAVGDLGGLSFAIGSTPAPPGLNDYQGKFLTVAHGKKAPVAVLRAMAKTFREAPQWTPPSPIDGLHPLMVELSARAAAWELPQLQRLMASNAPLHVRLVKDIDGSALEYRLVSLFSDELQYGLVGVFSSTTNRLAHFRFTTSRVCEANLAMTAADAPLWWSRRRMPRLDSPYFPFRRVLVDNRPTFERLVDGERLAPI